MVTLAERVFRAKLQMELEPTDFSIKRMLQARPDFITPQDMFVYLRSMQDRFWSEMQPAVQLLYEWAQYLRVPDTITDLKVQIWNNFLCRLSLDARLVTGKTAADSHGNEVLAIMMETVENTLLSRLSVSALQQQQVPPPPPPPQHQQQPSPLPPFPSSMQELYVMQQPPPGPGPDLQVMQRMGHLPPPQQQQQQPGGQLPGGGMQIRLHRTKTLDDEYAAPRKKKAGRKPRRTRERASNKGSRGHRETMSRRRRDDDDNDDEDDDDGEDDEDEDDDDDEDDMIAKAEERRRI